MEAFMKKKFLIALLSLAITQQTAFCADAHTIEYGHDFDPNFEVLSLLNTTQATLDPKIVAKNDTRNIKISAGLIQSWTVLAEMINTDITKFGKRSEEELTSGLKKCRPPLPLTAPIWAFFGCETLADLSLERVNTEFDALTAEDALPELLDARRTFVNQQLEPLGIVIKDNKDLLKGVRQTRYQCVPTLGVARYAALFNDIKEGNKTYPALAQVKEDFRKACDDIQITTDDCTAFQQGLMFVKMPEGDFEGIMPQTRKVIAKKIAALDGKPAQPAWGAKLQNIIMQLRKWLARPESPVSSSDESDNEAGAIE